jgi:hypothetical protein
MPESTRLVAKTEATLEVYNSLVRDVSRMMAVNGGIVTISSGVATVDPGGDGYGHYIIAAESGTADDLDTISGAAAGDIILLRADTGDSITLVHGSGNLYLPNSENVTISQYEMVMLYFTSTSWRMVIGSDIETVGDVNGPSSSTDNAIARFNGTGGKDIQNSVVTVADTTGAISISGHQALTDPTASPSGKYLKDDGTWDTPAGSGWDGDIADINLDGGTDIGAALADEDLILVDDGAGGTNRKSAMSRVKTYAQGIKLDDLTAPDDNTDLDASTSKHGLLLKATAPAANELNVVGIANGETAYTNKDLFNTTNPAALGVASSGTGVQASRSDHVHAMPSAADVGAATTSTKLDDFGTPDDNTDLDASTSRHGLLLKATAPAANELNVVGIGNGETAYTNKDLFNTTAPAAFGTAAAGTAVQASRSDHVHPGTITGLDIDGATDIGADLADADLIIVDDGAGGTNRKAAMSRVKTYAQGIKIDDLTAGDDNTDLDASTTKHGLLLKATAPAANELNVVGIANGETAYTNKDLFNTTTPGQVGTGAAGTAVQASRSDHVHGAPKLDDNAAPDDNTDLNASTSAHGLLLKATAPAAGLMNVVGIENGGTVYANKALFDASVPGNSTSVQSAATGSAMVAARRDHTHGVSHAITDNAVVTVDDASAADDDFARFTANGIEGIPVATAIAALLASALPENTAIILDAALSADGTYSGIVEAGTAGTALAFGDLVYLAAADSRWEKTDADAEATAGPVKLGICVQAAAGDGSATTILLWGKVRADSKFPAMTISAPLYVSTTLGEIQVSAPSANDIVRIVGHANTADELYFNPSQDWLELT